VGGAVGALARYAVGEAWAPAPGAVPWSTFAINVVGCFAIGLVLVAVTEGAGPPHPLARPFLGTGVIGGFTTFSTYVLETERLAVAGAPALALAYLFGTLAAALVAVQAGVATARAVLRARGAARDGRRTT
jgi:CrcB protein